MITFYIAATNKMTWGRGTQQWEAIGHALAHCFLTAEEFTVFQIRCPEGTVEKDIWVNDMGAIVAPAGVTIKELDQCDHIRVRKAFLKYVRAVNDL